jgi:hypothetical protein
VCFLFSTFLLPSPRGPAVAVFFFACFCILNPKTPPPGAAPLEVVFRSVRFFFFFSFKLLAFAFCFYQSPIFNLPSHPAVAVVLCAYLLPKSAVLNARTRNPNRFVSALAVETLLPASGSRSNYSHDFFVETPRSSRCIAYLRYATIFVLAEQVLLLCGGHQEVINAVGDGTELLLNNRPAESGAVRFEIVSPDVCRVL